MCVRTATALLLNASAGESPDESTKNMSTSDLVNRPNHLSWQLCLHGHVKRLFMTHGHFDMGYSESTFSKYAFGRGGGNKKEYTVHARENNDNSG